jgi:hypothetical protein
MRKLQFAILAASLAGAMSASATVISGTDLSSLFYHPNGGTAQYVAGTPDVAQLSTADAGLNGAAPAVFAKAANAPSLGTLSSLWATYHLYSSSGEATGPTTQPYWLTYLYAPGGGYIGVLSMGGPTLNGSSAIHVIYDFDTDPNPHTTSTYWGDTLSTLDSTLYNGTTTFGQLTVYETGPEIGDWDNGANVIPASASFDSITVIPEPTTMMAGVLLLLPFGASTLRILRKTRTA